MQERHESTSIETFSDFEILTQLISAHTVITLNVLIFT
jgi:hypothetical protein